jgi:integrase
MTGRRQFGNVRRLPSRRYQASYWHQGKRHVAQYTFTTRTLATDWLTSEKAKVLRGVWIDPDAGKITFAALSSQWLCSNPAKRESTLARDEIALRLHILPTLGYRKIGSITPVDVQNLVSAWSRDQSPRTARRTYGVLRAVLSYAVDVDLLVRTPCRAVRLPEVPASERRPLSVDDLSRIVAALPEEYRLTAWLGGVLGLRWGEVAGLRVGRVHLKERRIVVAEQASRGKGGRTVLGAPKSKAGIRTLAVPGALIAMIADHMARLGLTAADSDAFLFTSETGGPLEYSNFRRRHWIPAVSAAGLEGVGFHDLRRAAATALVTERVDIKTAQVRLGHSDPRLTLSIYAQATNDGDKAAANRLGAKFIPRRKSA